MNNSPLSSEGLHDQGAFLHLSELLRAHSVTCMHACGRADGTKNERKEGKGG